MITFTICLMLLVISYFTYGGYIAHIFGPTSHPTPALNNPDRVDYIPLPSWKIFLIQFLNIAGLGPILGAILGAKFGTASFIWIVVGTIFIGAVHDYVAGMLSLRNNGASLSEVIGQYLGKPVRLFMRLLILALLILMGTLLVIEPAKMLAHLTPNTLDMMSWIAIIMVFYLLATLLPIDEIIGQIYPVFAALFFIMAAGILVMLFVVHPVLPEVWNGLQNTHPDAASLPIFPIMFVSLACGAISGFHAVQSPIAARCMTSEHQGQPIFFGSMITEGIVALIWAAAATWFFHKNGMGETNAVVIADAIISEWMGPVLGSLAILGLIAAPLANGNAAFRSARLMIAEFIYIPQHKFINRLFITVPLFLISVGILLYSMKDTDGFNIVWTYFAWTNQLLATITLWTITIHFFLKKRPYFVTLIPAIFMTTVCGTYICISPDGFGCSLMTSYSIGFATAVVSILFFLHWVHKGNASR